jgi:hypothetical protein
MDEHYDVQAKRAAFLRETRTVTFVISGAVGVIAAALIAVGLTESVGRTLLGVALGALAFLLVRVFRAKTQAPGQRAVAWVLPLLAIVGTLLLASLPPEWDGLGWGFFGGVGIAVVAQVARTRRRLATDDELFIEAEARGFDAASPFASFRGRNR